MIRVPGGTSPGEFDMISRWFRSLPLAAVHLSLCAGLAVSAPAPAKDADPKLGRAIDAWSAPLVANGHLSGQLLVARGGKILVERSFGYANRELKAPMTLETRMCIASITKPMTTLLAFNAMEKRLIAYDDSIARWLPDFPEANRITVGLLLRHRSGIPHEILPDSESVRPRTAAEMVERARRKPLDFPPGTKSGYSTGGFTVLARILEIANGKSYEELLQEQIFGPLGMTHSSHSNSQMLLEGRASGYIPGPQGIQNAEKQDFSGLVGGGSVWSTARDLHRFVEAVINGKLGETSRQSWVRNGRLSFNGRVSGFGGYARWDSASGVEVTFLSNMNSGASGLLRDAVLALMEGKTPKPVLLPALATTPASEDQMRRIQGN